MKGDKDNEIETLPHIDSNCENCRWRIEGKKCAAFEGEIPDEIWNGTHDKVVEGQLLPFVFNELGPLI